MEDCIFCNLEASRIEDENELFLVIKDLYPVTEGHTLIIPKRHVSSFFELTDEEQSSFLEMLHLQKQKLASMDETITGFNVGINDGEDAGQTVMHCHIHLIPRRKGDMENPRGGVRGVIPEKQSY
jgi:ATP adenylyltransferase